MTDQEFDQLFDNGESILETLDISTAHRINCPTDLMTNQHPITPSPELVHQMTDHFVDTTKMVSLNPPTELIRKWEEDWHHSKVKHIELEDYIAAQSAQWGADQELEACINYFYEYDRQRWGENSKLITGLRAARRPKPPSLKEQALEALEEMNEPLGVVTVSRVSIIRRALEALDD